MSHPQSVSGVGKRWKEPLQKRRRIEMTKRCPEGKKWSSREGRCVQPYYRKHKDVWRMKIADIRKKDVLKRKFGISNAERYSKMDWEELPEKAKTKFADWYDTPKGMGAGFVLKCEKQYEDADNQLKFLERQQKEVERKQGHEVAMNFRRKLIYPVRRERQEAADCLGFTASPFGEIVG
jgi:hypothetical protein